MLLIGFRHGELAKHIFMCMPVNNRTDLMRSDYERYVNR